VNDRQAGRHRLRDEVSEGQEQREKERERDWKGKKEKKSGKRRRGKYSTSFLSELCAHKHVCLCSFIIESIEWQLYSSEVMMFGD